MKPLETSVPRIPGYTINSILGIGGFATVYLAQQHTLRRDVALKVMHPCLVPDEEFCARFLREARDTAVVSNHPNIVTIYDVGHVGSTYYIAMQYLPGDNLKERIESHAADSDINRLLHNLASALSHVHRKGFVHRDIKPANILFTESGDAVLSDFGVARMDNRSTQITQLGSIVGTAKYMSPEQSRGNSAIDARSDLYSLGVVLFEVLARHPPFEASDPMALMFMHQHEPVPVLPGKHSAYQPMLEKLMAKQVDGRYISACVLLDDLPSDYAYNAIAEYPLASHISTGHSEHSTNVETQTSTVLAAASGILFLLVCSLLFLYSQTQMVYSDISLSCPLLTKTQENTRDGLLELAGLHHNIGRLTHPPGANALEAYKLALDIDPCNQYIIDTVTQINLATQGAY